MTLAAHLIPRNNGMPLFGVLATMTDTLPKTRKDAGRTGSLYYMTGKACVNGHISKRYTPTGACVACNRESTRLQREQLKEALACAAVRGQTKSGGYDA